ncbi:hypothetical protein PAXRUDRAFT_833989 [Paxillus rubicundulus Ve08.2h10]|uniref:G-patch domain-containing protein n=1 Tax=Paxillus rubicundulus Ve08.2h10 TaxID=930991 RepID=A0A0D0DF81_9AGAM|nr:hypothetical protein PAXRUDRAFT_833989 [Paxillus rubicundulus Ve08.2h10]
MSSKVSFTIHRPTPISRPSSSGPESDCQFKVPALPRHLASARSSATGSPLAGSPRTQSSREDSDYDSENGLVFPNSFGLREAVSHHTDSSDEEDEKVEDELVSGFDQFGVKRLHAKRKKVPEEPLVIPSQPNPDWREAARRRRAAASRARSYISHAGPSFVPESALAAAGTDGSVGGLGTKDTINSGPQLSGLQVKKRVKVEVNKETVSTRGTESTTAIPAEQVKIDIADETEDQKALRAILAGDGDSSAHTVDIIPVPSEVDALKQDVEELPDVATADDYARIPISAFGVAMLRGMGWTDGTVASKSKKGQKSGLIEPYLPQARPALLGIGAKEREPDDDGSGKKKLRRPEKRYIPVVRKVSEQGESGGSKSSTTSRRVSRSPPRRERDDHVSDRERNRYGDHDRSRDGRDRRRDYRNRDRDRHDRRDHHHRDRGREEKEHGGRDRTRQRGSGDVDRERREGQDGTMRSND